MELIGTPSPEQLRQANILFEAPYVCAELMWAKKNAGLPTQRQIELLAENGYFNYSSNEIVDTFGGIDNLYFHTRMIYEEQKKERQERDEAIDREVRAIADSGEMPPEFFREVERYRTQSKDPAAPPKQFKVKISRKNASDKTLRERFCRLQLVRRMTPDIPSERQIDIALGFRIKNHIVLGSGFLAEIKKSNQHLTNGQIELAAEPMYDYIFPDIRSGYLKQLRRAAYVRLTPPAIDAELLAA